MIKAPTLTLRARKPNPFRLKTWRSSIQTGRLPVHVNSVNTGVTFWNPEDARKCIGVTCM